MARSRSLGWIADQLEASLAKGDSLSDASFAVLQQITRDHGAVIFGGDGDDTLNGNGGTDTFNGGQGTNTLDAAAPEKDSQNLAISTSVLQALAILSGL